MKNATYLDNISEHVSIIPNAYIIIQTIPYSFFKHQQHLPPPAPPAIQSTRGQPANLIPFLAILISLHRIAVSNLNAVESLKLLTTGLWVLIPVAVAIGGGLVLIVSLNLKKSLDAMVVVLKQVTIGKFGSRVKVTSNDEIGYVGDAINEMTKGLIERERMQLSLNLAKEVQQNLLPNSNLKVNGFDIAGKSVYCDETGGDYYDFISIGDDDKRVIGVVIGDVSGHGISSALLMATVRSSLRQRASLTGNIAKIITDVNRQLVKDVEDSGQFMTMFFLALDTETRQFQWVRAGRDPAILNTLDKFVDDVKFEDDITSVVIKLQD